MRLNVHNPSEKKDLSSIVAIIWKPASCISIQITRCWFLYGNNFILDIWELNTFRNVQEAATEYSSSNSRYKRYLLNLKFFFFETCVLEIVVKMFEKYLL